MYTSQQYPTPPPYGYDQQYRQTPPMSPGPAAHAYYSPRRGPVDSTPHSSPKVSGHSRRASHAVPNSSSYNYTSPRGPMPTFSGGFTTATPRQYATPRATPEYVPIYDTEPKQSQQARPRRASHSTRSQPTPATPKKSSTKTAPKATAQDAQRAGIPAGFSYKNWDPTEEPIMLLGSVFDANSLGKWIYDWTVFHYGPATPLSEMAGELWLLLIHLAGKVKKADAEISGIRGKANHELVEDFLESGSRLWIRFAKLLKICEEHMWKSAKKENHDKTPVSMGKNSGLAFVECLFGRDKQLETTEKLMTGIRLWSMRFDANVEEILRNPTA